MGISAEPTRILLIRRSSSILEPRSFARAEWECEMEGRAPPYLRLHANLAAVGFDDLARDRQSKAGALLAASRPHAGLLVKVKQSPYFLCGNSLTLVAHLDQG